MLHISDFILSKLRMDAKYPELNLEEPICRKIKNIYYSEITWSHCYKDVSIKFSQLKTIAKKFWPDKNSLELVQELYKFSEKDIKEAFETKE